MKILYSENGRRIYEAKDGRVVCQWRVGKCWHTGSVFMPWHRVTKRFVRDFILKRVV